MVTANHHRRAQLTIFNHVVKGLGEAGTVFQTHPANACRQALEADALAGHVQPVVQVRVIRDQLFDLGVGFIDIFRVTTERRPTERANALAEQRTNVSRHKTGEVKSVGDAFFKGHLANVVAIIEGGRAVGLQRQHGFNLHRHGLLGRFNHCRFVFLPHLGGLGQSPALRQVAIERVVGGGLVGDHIRGDTTGHQLTEDISGVTQQTYRHRFTGGLGGLNHGQGVVQAGGFFVNVAGTQTKIDTAFIAFHGQHGKTRHGGCQRLGTTHTAEAASQYPLTAGIATEVLLGNSHEGFVGALHNAL